MQNDRFDALLHLVVASAGAVPIDIGRLRAALWLIERESHIAYGRGLAGREFIKLGDGPTPRGFSESLSGLVRERRIVEHQPERIDYANRTYRSTAVVDDAPFTDAERSLVMHVVAFVLATAKADLTAVLHDEIWRDHEIGETTKIDLAAAAAFIKPVDEAALAWARRVEKERR